jgi:spore maturation protein SpmA
MQRLLGLVLTLVGVIAVLSSGYYILQGQPFARIILTYQHSVSALLAGLIGVLLLTLGLIRMRD